MCVGSDRGDSIKVKVVRPFPVPERSADTDSPCAQCRNFTPTRSTKFHLEVYSSAAADITVWLPSDFKGRIHRSAVCRKTSFSAGFTNRIMRNACLTQSRRPSLVSTSDCSALQYPDIYISDKDAAHASTTEKACWAAAMASEADEDEVVVHTSGQVTFRMWDIHRAEPEARCKEACKRVFGLGWCAKQPSELEIDWDFLLDD